MLLLPLLMLNIYATELATERYCFSTEELAARTAERLRPVLLPMDQLYSDRNCFTINMPPHRRELVQQLLRNLEPSVEVSYSSALQKKEPCHLRIERQGKSEASRTEVGLDKKLVADLVENRETARQEINIHTSEEFSFLFQQDLVRGKCRFISTSLYEIFLELAQDAKAPTTQSANASPPPQKRLSLSTQLQITRGEKIEIGALLQQKNESGQQISEKLKLVHQQKSSDAQERVFLSIY